MAIRRIMRGKFITFEGGESGGKTTQAEALAGFLKTQNIETVVTREPGGASQSEDIRKLLVRGAPDRWSTFSELLLFTAARTEHVVRIIEPALVDGIWVLCDRFIDSCYAYQGLADGFDLDFIRSLQRLAIGAAIPDVTFLLDIPVAIALARAEQRNAESRFEHKPIEYHEAVRRGFLQLAEAEPERILTLDATQTFEKISKKIEEEILHRFSDFSRLGASAPTRS